MNQFVESLSRLYKDNKIISMTSLELKILTILF